jgi:hypothetical protein
MHIYFNNHMFLRNVIQIGFQVKYNNEYHWHGFVHVVWCMSILFFANVRMILSVRMEE